MSGMNWKAAGFYVLPSTRIVMPRHTQHCLLISSYDTKGKDLLG